MLLSSVTTPSVGEAVRFDVPHQDFSIQVVCDNGTALVAWEISIDGEHWTEISRGMYGNIMLPLRGWPTQLLRGNVLGLNGGASVTAYYVAV